MEKSEKNTVSIKAKKATKESKSWHDFALQTIQKTPERQENAAKFLTGMISISLTIYLRLSPKIAKSANETRLDYMEFMVLLSWLAALILSFFVFYPFRYSYIAFSSKSIKTMHRRVIKRKQFYLIASSVLFIMSLLLACIKYFLTAM